MQAVAIGRVKGGRCPAKRTLDAGTTLTLLGLVGQERLAVPALEPVQ